MLRRIPAPIDDGTLQLMRVANSVRQKALNGRTLVMVFLAFVMLYLLAHISGSTHIQLLEQALVEDATKSEFIL